MRKELNTTGVIVNYPGAWQNIPDDRIFLNELFSQSGFICTIIAVDGCKWTIELKNPVLGFDKSYNVFLGHIRNESRNDEEKKIQLNGKDPRIIEPGKENIVLGVYCYSSSDPLKDLIIAGWSIDPETTYPGNPSIRGINVKLFQQAKFKGFIPNQFRNNFVYSFRPEFIYYYLLNRDLLHGPVSFEALSSIKEPIGTAKELDEIPRNKIIYGAPGTGKSFDLNVLAKKYFKDENTVRVTFYPGYSYQQFVGTYKPTPIYKTLAADPERLYGTDKTTEFVGADKFEPLIDYSFVAGPLINQLVMATENPEEDFIIIIEEINRANVSSVFGDVFQLLDRNSAGVSEYDIEFNADIKNYLISKGISTPKIKLPKNLFIWATMNNADQGVLPLDAAFKRRWSFVYIHINEFEYVVDDFIIQFKGTCFNWNEFRKTLNDVLKEKVHEDKLLGPFFMNRKELADPNSIKNKLLLYLREDVLRHNPEILFGGKLKTFSDIVNVYDDKSKAKEDIFVHFDWSSLKEIPCDKLKAAEYDDSIDVEFDEVKEELSSTDREKIKEGNEASNLKTLELLGGADSTKKIGNIEFIQLITGDKIYKKTSRIYKDGNFWFGILPNVMKVLSDQGVGYVIFILSGVGFVKVPMAVLVDYLPKVNFTQNSDGSHHYHLTILQPPDVSFYNSKDSSSVDLKPYFTPFA